MLAETSFIDPRSPSFFILKKATPDDGLVEFVNTLKPATSLNANFAFISRTLSAASSRTACVLFMDEPGGRLTEIAIKPKSSDGIKPVGVRRISQPVITTTSANPARLAHLNLISFFTAITYLAVIFSKPLLKA
ncbi:hypothetical protein D3C81_1645400 [compost metagenome]